MALHRLSVDVGYPIVVIDISPAACVRTFKRVVEARIKKNGASAALRQLAEDVADNRDKYITKIEPGVEVDCAPYFDHYGV